MRKRMLLFLALSGVGLLAALGFYTDARNEVLSEMALSQLEALASGEGEDEGTEDCWWEYRLPGWFGGGTYVLVCRSPDQVSCQMIKVESKDRLGKCKFPD